MKKPRSMKPKIINKKLFVGAESELVEASY